jgi:hypothetical protein
MRGPCALQRLASQNGGLLHRILHRLLEVIVRDLQAVLAADWFRVSHPRADDVRRKTFFEFRLPRAPHQPTAS